MTARLSIYRREFGNGKGVDVMGHPLNVVGWLAGKLAAAGAPRDDHNDRQHGPDPIPGRR
jgi:2-keto-4-pentenoate hydratase